MFANSKLNALETLVVEKPKLLVFDLSLHFRQLREEWVAYTNIAAAHHLLMSSHGQRGREMWPQISDWKATVFFFYLHQFLSGMIHARFNFAKIENIQANRGVFIPRRSTHICQEFKLLPESTVAWTLPVHICLYGGAAWVYYCVSHAITLRSLGPLTFTERMARRGGRVCF